MNDLFASLYELIHYDQVLSPVLYTDSKYSVYGLIALISIVVAGLLYYKGMDRPKFTSYLYWLLVMVGMLAINFGIVYSMVDPIAAQSNLGSDSSIGVCLAHSVWAAVGYVLASIGFKFISNNHSRIPF